jgi:predicted nucleotidyltransferase
MLEFNKILEFLNLQYPAHTVILYGSRAGNDFRSNSDYDLLCIKEQGQRVREIITLENMAIDLIVDDESIFERPFDTLYLWQSKILKDEKGFGQKLVDKNQKLLSEPPQPMSTNRIRQRKKQVMDELVYIQENSLLGHYRRHDLLVKLRSLYLSFKGLWDLGDKHCFSQMEDKDRHAFQLFKRAIQPNASFEEIKELVHYVVGI